MTNFKKKIQQSFLCFGCFVLLTTSAFGQIQIDNFSAATNDRFGNDPGAFIGAGYDWSGVTRASGWGTLIHPRVIMTANHAQVSNTLRFFPDNDPAGSPIFRQVVSGAQMGNTDIFLSLLDAPVTPNIKVYNYATTPITGTAGTLTTDGPFDGLDAFIMGRSPTVQQNQQDHAIGENVITGYIEDLAGPIGSVNDLIVLEYNDPADANYRFHESHVNTGDSGAPLFIDNGNGDLLLLGVNTAQLSSNGNLFGTGVTYTGNLTTEINNFLAANVPEPTGFVFLLGASCFVALRRKRS